MRKKKNKKEVEDSQVTDEEIKLYKELNKEKQEEVKEIEDTEVIYGELEG